MDDPEHCIQCKRVKMLETVDEGLIAFYCMNDNGGVFIGSVPEATVVGDLVDRLPIPDWCSRRNEGKIINVIIVKMNKKYWELK